jgi:uncharacterized protein YjbI with pentapeptide repeats
MKWHPITIQDDQHDGNSEPDKRFTEGLSASPELLHQNFLSDLGHLQEIHDIHQTTMESNFSPVEANFDRIAGVLSTESMLEKFDGKSSDDHLSIPLHGCELSGVKLSAAELGDNSIIKLNVTGRDGDEFEQAFSLPSGSRLATATWDGGELHLSLNRLS